MSYMMGEEMHGRAQDGCGCGCGIGMEARRFLTKEEKTEILKEYRDGLQNELKAVDERMKALGKDN